MKRILQKDRTGCGIACVAMITGKSYAQVKKEILKLPSTAENGYFYTTATDLRKLSSKFGVTLAKRMRNFRAWSKIPNNSIVAINYKDYEEGPMWHWVVFYRVNGNEFVIDPKMSIKSKQRTDFGRMKAKWYLPVYKG